MMRFRLLQIGGKRKMKFTDLMVRYWLSSKPKNLFWIVHSKDLSQINKQVNK